MAPVYLWCLVVSVLFICLPTQPTRALVKPPPKHRYPKEGIPCVYNADPKAQKQPPGCKERIKKCDDISEKEKRGAKKHAKTGVDTLCSTHGDDRLSETIFSAADPKNKFYVEFDDKDGNCLGIIMHGGECWAQQPNTNNDYNCMGRCGPGCTSTLSLYVGVQTCSNWAWDCLLHDVCSFYFGATTGHSDPHCGEEFSQAANDWSHCCWSVCEAPCSKDVGDICPIFKPLQMEYLPMKKTESQLVAAKAPRRSKHKRSFPENHKKKNGKPPADSERVTLTDLSVLEVGSATIVTYMTLIGIVACLCIGFGIGYLVRNIDIKI